MIMAKKYKCPYCGKAYLRANLVTHIDKMHGDILPMGYTPLRTAYDWINYGTIGHQGKCVICGGPTLWDENKGRYDRLCGKKSCHDIYVKKFEDNMRKTHGTERMTDSIDGLEKMLNGRKISGRYRFQDGGVKTYTGSYEKDALEFMDKVMECKSEDIMTPGPPMQYEYQDTMHWYIPDIYYIPYNLLIEVKDGGDKPNTMNMPDYRARQIAKEKHVLEKTQYNYLRLTNKDCSQLLATMADLKMEFVEGTNERVININENMFAGMQGMFPMQNHKENDVYVINYLQNNVFSDGEPDFAVSDSPKFDTVFYRDKEGKLRKGDMKIFEDCTYNLYHVKDRKRFFESNVYDKVDQFVPYGFIYEAVFDKPLYTVDQIKYEPLAEETMDYYEFLKCSHNMLMHYVFEGTHIDIQPEVACMMYESVSEDSKNVISIDHSGKVYERSLSVPGLRASLDSPMERAMLRYIDNMKGGCVNG